MGAGALDHFARMIQKPVKLLGQWLDLARKTPAHPFGLAITHSGHGGAHAQDRPQRPTHQHHHASRQRRRKQRQQAGRREGEITHAPVGRAAVLGGSEHHRALGLDQNGTHMQAQGFKIRSAGLADDRRARLIQRRAHQRPCGVETLIGQRVRAQDGRRRFDTRREDLPVTS